MYRNKFTLFFSLAVLLSSSYATPTKREAQDSSSKGESSLPEVHAARNEVFEKALRLPKRLCRLLDVVPIPLRWLLQDRAGCPRTSSARQGDIQAICDTIEEYIAPSKQDDMLVAIGCPGAISKTSGDFQNTAFDRQTICEHLYYLPIPPFIRNFLEQILRCDIVTPTGARSSFRTASHKVSDEVERGDVKEYSDSHGYICERLVELEVPEEITEILNPFLECSKARLPTKSECRWKCSKKPDKVDCRIKCRARGSLAMNTNSESEQTEEEESEISEASEETEESKESENDSPASEESQETKEKRSAESASQQSDESK